jgi:transposase-like protein
MTKTQVEVITSVERRRRWWRGEKERIVAASMEPGAVASAVAREAGIHASQLYRWRQELCDPVRAAPGFAAMDTLGERLAQFQIVAMQSISTSNGPCQPATKTKLRAGGSDAKYRA